VGDSTFAVLVVVYVAVGSAAPIDGTAAAVVDTTFAVDAAIAVGAAAVAVGSTSYNGQCCYILSTDACDNGKG